MMQLGDMIVSGEFPPKLVKALAVIANTLHPAFDRQPWLGAPGWSKRSCVLASLACRGFLVGEIARDYVVARKILLSLFRTLTGG
jgi:hypothetical protein